MLKLVNSAVVEDFQNVLELSQSPLGEEHGPSLQLSLMTFHYDISYHFNKNWPKGSGEDGTWKGWKNNEKITCPQVQVI